MALSLHVRWTLRDHKPVNAWGLHCILLKVKIEIPPFFLFLRYMLLFSSSTDTYDECEKIMPVNVYNIVSFYLFYEIILGYFKLEWISSYSLLTSTLSVNYNKWSLFHWHCYDTVNDISNNDEQFWRLLQLFDHWVIIWMMYDYLHYFNLHCMHVWIV